MRLIGFLLVGVLALRDAGVRSSHAAGDPLASISDLFRANSYTVTNAENEPGGPGIDLLLKGASDAQFVCVGEQHNSKQIPPFTTALFKRLHERYGFNHLALEQDPFVCEMASAKDVVGSRQEVAALAQRYPNAFTFATDQELELIAAVAAAARPSGDAVWGLDQVFGARHVLDQLLVLAPNAQAHDRTAALIAVVEPYEKIRFRPGRRYIVDVAKPDDFRTLADAFHAPPDSRPDFLIRQLALSNEIYRDYLGRVRGELTGFDQAYKREENMKYLFMRQYRRAQSAGEQLPKVLLKFGHAHVIRGSGWNTVFTLGNFVSEFAKSNNMKSFHLTVYHNNKSGSYGVLGATPQYRPLADAVTEGEWAVVDLRALRPRVYAGKVQGINAELAKVIFGFDAALLIGGGRRGMFDLTRQKSS